MDVMHWKNNGLVLLDQSQLPDNREYVVCTHHRQVVQAIRELQVRGAPAIGLAAAFGYVLAAFDFSGPAPELEFHLEQAARELKGARPTAVNLAWAVDRMRALFNEIRNSSPEQIRSGLLAGAQQLHTAQLEQDERIASYGDSLVPAKANVLTYCNTGALATAGSGTALGVIVRAHQSGKDIHVYVPETRPLLQGARLTAWELEQAGVPFTLITDNMIGYLFWREMVDLAIVGADRIVANGDFANKIGTYGLAILASHHCRPFYVAAPISTFDFSLREGGEIPVEMRPEDEVRTLKGCIITVAKAPVLNPSFDVTPCSLVSGYITEYGVFKNIQELQGPAGFNSQIVHK